MLQKCRQWVAGGKWKEMKKSDWVVIALVGVLLLIIAMPMEKQTAKNQKIQTDVEEGEILVEGKLESVATERWQEDAYVSAMEEKLEQVLAQMDGVGAVQVMITVADYGEQVVEKDVVQNTTTTTESDGTGGSRTTTQQDLSESTIYVENGEETYPYIQKEKTPEIEGVVVVAEGGGNAKVVSDISDAVKALFPVEAHRIKVVKMCPREE